MRTIIIFTSRSWTSAPSSDQPKPPSVFQIHVHNNPFTQKWKNMSDNYYWSSMLRVRFYMHRCFEFDSTFICNRERKLTVAWTCVNVNAYALLTQRWGTQNWLGACTVVMCQRNRGRIALRFLPLSALVLTQIRTIPEPHTLWLKANSSLISNR